jgi:hypothetical protein
MLRVRDPFKQPVGCSQYWKRGFRFGNERSQFLPMPLAALTKEYRVDPAA